MRQTQTGNSKIRPTRLVDTRSKSPGEAVVIVEMNAEGTEATAEKEKMEGGMDDKDAVNGGDTLLTVHRIAAGLFEAGAFDGATMRRFDELCLTPVQPLGGSEIRRLRESSGVSQAVLARILNVTVSTVGQWERGEKRPSGAALKLLSLMRAKGIGAVL